MKIASVRIENFRSFDDVSVEFNNYTCLVGPNGSGKSGVLCALNVFFRENGGSATDLTALQGEDFHQKVTAKPVRITVTFDDLSPGAQEDFKDYFRQGQLVVMAKAEYNVATRRAEVKQYGLRLGMADFAPFFKADGDGAKVAELQKVYETIKSKYTELPAAGSKPAMTKALSDYEAKHPELHTLLESDDEFYGFSKGKNRLAKHIQWVYVPAVKDAASEQIEARNTALGKLLQRAVSARTSVNEKVAELRQKLRLDYQAVLDEHASVLDGISAALRVRLIEWAHSDATVRLQWRQDPEKSTSVQDPLAMIVAGEHGFEGEVTRLGHGLQRSYLIALLQELAAIDDKNAPKLILGCEEPELYQHPPQARHLASVLHKLSKASSQVVITTHSPTFISGNTFEDVRMIRKDHSTKASCCSRTTFERLSKTLHKTTGETLTAPQGTFAKIHQALQPQLSEMFFAQRLILVEGVEDVAYVCTYLTLADRWNEFRRLGLHVVPVGGKSEMIQPYMIALALNVPTFIVFDADADAPEENGARKKHERDNRILLALSGNSGAPPMPVETFWGSNAVVWQTNIANALAADAGKDTWAALGQSVNKEFGHVGNLKKNTLAIGAKVAKAWDNGCKFPTLDRLVSSIFSFAGGTA